jgi:hypothetical protein
MTTFTTPAVANVNKNKALITINKSELQLLGANSDKNLMDIVSHISKKMSSGFDENSGFFSNLFPDGGT